jgi:hypothetical protein
MSHRSHRSHSSHGSHASHGNHRNTYGAIDYGKPWDGGSYQEAHKNNLNQTVNETVNHRAALSCFWC